MTSVIFQNGETRGFVATDALAANNNGHPGLYRSKAFYLAHLKTITFVTGWSDILENWFVYINRQMLLAGIEHLDCHATETLQRIWSEFLKENKDVLKKHNCQFTTIYHMGVSEVTGKIVTYAYRSTTGFASEKLPPGLAVKPECTVPEGGIDLMEMMKEQRHIQQNSGLPLDQQIHIGGEIHLYELTAEGCHISTYGLFDDRDQMFMQMIEKHKRERENAA